MFPNHAGLHKAYSHAMIKHGSASSLALQSTTVASMSSVEMTKWRYGDMDFLHDAYLISISVSLCSFDGANDDEQHHSPNSGDNDAADQATAGVKAKQIKEKPAEKGANHPNNQITHQTKPAALDQDACQPSSNDANDEKP